MSNSVVHRTHRDNRFSVINLDALENPNLKPLTKVVLYYGVTRPPEWDINVRDIAAHCGVERHAVYNAMKELESLGYLTRTQETGTDGKFRTVAFDWYESPRDKNLRTQSVNDDPESFQPVVENTPTEPVVEKPEAVQPQAANLPPKYIPSGVRTSGSNYQRERDAREPDNSIPEPGLPEPLAGAALRYYLTHRADACLKHGCSPPRVYDRDTRRMAEILTVEFQENFTGAEALECITEWLNAEPDLRTKQASFAPGFCIPFVRNWIADYPRRQAEARAKTERQERKANLMLLTPEQEEEQRQRNEAARQRAMATILGTASKMSMPMGQIIGPGEPQSIPKSPVLEIDDGEIARRKEQYKRQLRAQEVAG